MTELIWTAKEFNEWIQSDAPTFQPVVELNLGGCDMTDLPPEIALLTDLKRLYIDCNQLTSIEMVSRLTNLTDLDCSYNKLTSLNVSQLSYLTGLNCCDNQLSQLDVSGLTHLTMIHCCINRLTSLDINHLTGLTELDCSFNQLTTLDVSKLFYLTEFHCGNNRFA